MWLRLCCNLLNRHGYVNYPCEEVQALLISHVDPFSPFFGPFLALFALLCSPKYKT
ncbi:hypothetical protein F383_37400 [Gossypium arboreum]|uniref:Uncharacterized protein n=1 Tax=Gossypium arboreum TaxID=29729 RepID=A0A0B0M7Y0_GOSAR|nr:hypothetical protein F383_37400 [Gossypium arboreum]